MKKIGFYGGSTMWELGSANDVSIFFKCIETYVDISDLEKDWSLITDRLYRRYVKHEDLKATLLLMEEIKKIFEETPSDVNNEIKEMSKGKVDIKSSKNLREIFQEYFNGFEHCAESAQLFYASWNKYKPIRIGITDVPQCFDDKNRPLDEFDKLTLEDDPFWVAVN